MGKAVTGKGKGKAILPKRHSKSKGQRDSFLGVTKPAIRRLARRAEIKRINGAVYGETQNALKRFYEVTLKDAATLAILSKRQTVMVSDVLYALQRSGRTLYGYK
jgi:histone H4